MIVGVELKIGLIGWFVIHKFRLDIVYLFAEFDDSSFSSFRDTIGPPKLVMGHVTRTTPLLRVICYPYART